MNSMFNAKIMTRIILLRESLVSSESKIIAQNNVAIPTLIPRISISLFSCFL